MSRSPLAYPLNRGADMDVGGAADLQTDVMRFMAIISLCLVAIFALVQSVPIAPPAVPEVTAAQTPTPQPVASTVPEAAPKPEPKPEPDITLQTPATTVSLTRPKWTPKYPITPAAIEVAAEPATEAIPTPIEAQEGFTLRFESDTALTRLVAAGQVGVYAIANDAARRMTVSESRISFWDASVPNSFHEMEVSTVPRPVIDALARSGVDTREVSWGVTLPGKLRSQLDGLMQQHTGGSLLIGINGQIRLEDS